MVTENQRDCSSLAKDAQRMPFPKEEVTPPVTKIYLVIDKFDALRGAKIDVYLVNPARFVSLAEQGKYFNVIGKCKQCDSAI